MRISGGSKSVDVGWIQPQHSPLDIFLLFFLDSQSKITLFPGDLSGILQDTAEHLRIHLFILLQVVISLTVKIFSMESYQNLSILSTLTSIYHPVRVWTSNYHLHVRHLICILYYVMSCGFLWWLSLKLLWCTDYCFPRIPSSYLYELLYHRMWHNQFWNSL